MTFLFMLLAISHVLWLSGSQALAAPYEFTHCSTRCGNIEIPYPFGVEPQCYEDKSYEVFCNTSFSPPKPFLTSINMELLEVSLSTGQVRVNNPVISSNCSNTAPSNRVYNLSNSPFVYSNTSNRFTAMGCDNFARLSQNSYSSVIGACLSMCDQTPSNTSACYGLNCCQTIVPPQIKSFEASMIKVFNNDDGSGCRSAFMVEQDWFNARKPTDVQRMEYVPAVLRWGTYQGACDISETEDLVLCSFDGYCWKQLSPSHHCICQNCKDVETCLDPSSYSCGLLCTNNAGGYNCSCPDGYQRSYDRCYQIRSPTKKSRASAIIIGCGSGLGALLFLIGAWWLYKVMKRRKEIKLKDRFFKRNGGLLLQQQLTASENSLEQTKIFSSKELEKATDNYNINRILGQGGQGTVYKGMLTDGRIVAIKKSKVIDAGRLEQFINEVVILSQINHRNVVKLFGCCLETEVPLLVYEFIPNGTLFHHLHHPSDEFPVTWEIRLRIAVEVANAVAYLHSAASMPIFHRDIKSTNILLDDKYRAKISDFGTSRSIAVDQTHLTTRVLGTFGYLDPEYFQTSQFTEKSDVYSFGVVLVELLTGQKPISITQAEEGRSLATHFLVAMEENHLFDILDSRVVKEGGKEEIIAVAKLARRCLDLNGKKRPNMKTVAMELEMIRSSQGASSTIQEDYDEVDYTVGDTTEPWDASSFATGSCTNTSTISVHIDKQPLL